MLASALAAWMVLAQPNPGKRVAVDIHCSDGVVPHNDNSCLKLFEFVEAGCDAACLTTGRYTHTTPQRVRLPHQSHLSLWLRFGLDRPSLVRCC